MSDDRVAELEKEVRELNLKLEIERQKNRKLEQENERMKEKMNRQVRPERPVTLKMGVPTMAPGSATPAQPSMAEGSLTGGASEQEIDELREKLRKLTSQKDVSEQEKWDQSKEVIEQKETLQRLRVKKINIKKDIDELNERLDRKENQNFKSRLELTDLKKEETKTHGEADDAEKERINLEEEIARFEGLVAADKAALRDEKIARDKVQFALNRALKIKGEYESHPFARFYNK